LRRAMVHFDLKAVSRIALGALLVILCVYASVAALTYLAFAFANLFPRGWWSDHATLIFFVDEVVAYLPFVLILGVVFPKVFRTRPVARALACVLLGLVISNASLLLESPAYLRLAIGEILFSNGAFLLGVPITIHLLSRSRLRAVGMR
jgi:hypothetical protein